MILYPTDTIYGLGVNVLDDEALEQLFRLKGRDERQTVSWLVRNIEDIEKYAVLSESAKRVAERFLPGPLTLVLPAKDTVPADRRAPDRTIGVRISADPIAQQVVADFMEKYDAPLTCTSANVSGLAPESSPESIIKQFIDNGRDASVISEVVDDGQRVGAASTVVKIIGDEIVIIREGSLSKNDILQVL